MHPQKQRKAEPGVIRIMEPDDRREWLVLRLNVYNRLITIILTIVSGLLAASVHWFPDSLIPVAGVPLCSLLVVVVQILKKDTVSRRFSKEDWAKEKDDEASLRIIVGNRFKGAPFQVLEKKGPGSYAEIGCYVEYRPECGEVVLGINGYENRMDGLFLIGGPLSRSARLLPVVCPGIVETNEYPHGIPDS